MNQLKIHLIGSASLEKYCSFSGGLFDNISHKCVLCRFIKLIHDESFTEQSKSSRTKSSRNQNYVLFIKLITMYLRITNNLIY